MTNAKPSISFTNAINQEVAIAEAADHNSLARQLRAAADAVTASDAAHISTAIANLTVAMVKREEGANFDFADADLNVVKQILTTAASGAPAEIVVEPVNPDIAQ